MKMLEHPPGLRPTLTSVMLLLFRFREVRAGNMTVFCPTEKISKRSEHVFHLMSLPKKQQQKNNTIIENI